MVNNSTQTDIISILLSDRDAEYRRANVAEQRLAELSDVADLKTIYEQKIIEKEKLLEENERLINAKNDQIRRLEEKLLYLERKMWGQMSEKRRVPDNPDQLKLDFDKIELTEQEEIIIKQVLEEIKEHKKVPVKAHEKKVPVREKLPEDLRHIEEHIYPDGYLGHEDEWILFKETETSEHLEIKPAEFYVRVTIRHKGMRKDSKEIFSASVPNEPIAKSYASASLLTDLIVGKYVNHLPFHRQIQMYKRLGVSIPASTIQDWFYEVGDLLRPIYYRLKELILSSDYVQSDETTIPVVDNEKHKTIKGYLWLVQDIMNQLVFFSYHDGSRSSKVVLELFKDFRGAIQTDGYAGYNILDKFDGITTLLCWAHCRRYFDRALSNDKDKAEYALTQIGMLYDVEHMADDQDLNFEERSALRKRLAYPIIRAFEKWCLTEYPNVLPKSPIGKAISYFLSYSRQLSRYTMDGRYKPDNNLIENSVRPVAIGRKNYLFCGNHDAAENAAIIYSLMGCCKTSGVDFNKWMDYFLNHIHEYDDDYSKDLADLLPHNLKKNEIL
ncbi:MAG: IS66 family transposase [Bacteroidales bacterium]